MPDPTFLLIWATAIAGAYVLLFWVAERWARHTTRELDDVIVGVLQKPLFLILILWAVKDLAAHSDLSAAVASAIDRWASFFLIGAITWGVWRLTHDMVLYYGQQLARRTESSFDDVLIPVLDVLAPVIVIGTGIIRMLRLLGADISTVVLTAGGAALIVGLALGDTLKNILGGVMLLIDTPFRFGDLVLWDGVVCQIKHIGLRVTTFYNTEDHSDIFLPNSILAASKLTNLTRPSPDLRLPIDVVIADGSRTRAAKALLHEVADANPYVLGNVPTKLRAMRCARRNLPEDSPLARELDWGLAALGCERQVDRHLAGIDALLGRLLATIRGAEKGGLSEDELAAITAELEVLDAHDERLKAALRRWARVRTRDPQLKRYREDRESLLADAEARLQAYEHRLAELRHHLKHPGLYDAQRLDDLVASLRSWLPQMFKAVTPAWKHPFVSVVQAAPAGASLRLFVYVDDIHLEHFMRRQRVATALREMATAALHELMNG